MQPLKECAPEILKRIKVVLCDIDDTLTWQGRLGADAYGAMEALRKQGFIVPDHVKKLSDESAKHFKDNPLGEFVYLRTYARWISEENRRETWVETVDRYVDFMKENAVHSLKAEEDTSFILSLAE